MSKFSGKCDFYDHLFMTSDPNKTELDLFNDFKKQTGGIIHMYQNITVTKWNLDFCKEKCKSFDYYKVGNKLRYKYYGKEYKSLKTLNKENVYFIRDIKFETMLDLVQYYPYLISIAACSKENSYILLSDESFVKEEYDESLKFGYERTMRTIYERDLAEEYGRVAMLYSPTLIFNNADDAKLWYELNYGKDK